MKCKDQYIAGTIYPYIFLLVYNLNIFFFVIKQCEMVKRVLLCILILHIAVDIGRHSLLFHSFISRFLKVVLRKKGEQLLII